MKIIFAKTAKCGSPKTTRAVFGMAVDRQYESSMLNQPSVKKPNDFVKRLAQSLLLSGLIGFVLLAGPRANAMYDPGTYNANDPAYPVTYSEAQKAAQLVAGTNMMNAIIAAANSGATNYTIPPGVYRIYGGYYTLNNLTQSFTINCSNVEMWLVADTNLNSLNWIHINNCSNVSVLGPITFDSDNRIICQGTVESWNAANGTINLQIMPGYNPTNFWDISHPANANSGGMCWHYNTNGVCLTKPAVLTSTNYDPGDLTQVQINVGTGYFTSGAGNLLHVGDMILDRCWYCNERDPVILQNNNQKVVLSGLQCYDGAMWFIGGANTLLMTNCSTYREPGGNELGGGEEIWDFYANNVVFDGCNNGPAWDDGIDCQGTISDKYVVGMLSSNVAVLQDAPPTGTLLTFFRGENWMPEGQAKVALPPALITNTGTLQFSNLLSAFNAEHSWWPNAQGSITTSTPLYAVTLDRNFNVAPYSIEERSDGLAQSGVVNNCYFADMNAAEVLMNGFQSLVITSNLFERGSASAIWCQLSRFWMPGGPVPRNTTVACNTFNDCPGTYGGANNYSDTVLIGEDSVGSPAQQVCGNINIVGNVFTNSAANDISVFNCYNVNISSNISYGCQPPTSSGMVQYETVANASIFVAACSNVLVQGNQLLNPTPYCTNTVEIGPFVSDLTGSDLATAEFSTNGTWYDTGWNPTNQFVTYNMVSPLQCPQAIYTFDGNTLDSSGYGRNGTAIANFNNGVGLTYPAYVAGKLAGTQAISLNGGSVNLPCSVGVTNFSIAMWVKTTATSGDLCFGDIPGYTYDFGVALNGSKFAMFIGNPAVSGDTWLLSTKSINDGNWHHCVAEWNCGTGAMSVYVDGVLSGSLTGPAGVRWATLGFQNVGYGDRSQPLTISLSSGAVADLQLYNYLISTAEISALYNLQPPPAPATPTGLAATAGNNQVVLNWNPPTGATGFNLYRSLTSGGSYAMIATNVNAISYTDSGLANGTTYYYEVAATNSGGASANSAAVSATPQANPLVMAPTGLSATSVTTSQINLGWVDNSGGTAGFEVERSYDRVNFYPVGSVDPGITTFTDSGLVTGATYYYQVAAREGLASSPASPILTVTTLPQPPTGLSAQTGNGEVDLSWTASLGAAAYNVSRSTTNGGPYVTVASVSGTSFIDASVTNGVTYYYVVTATAGNAISANSGQVSATPEPALPVALYSFEGNVLDSSGNENNGANSGAVFVAGKIGEAASFNGSSAYVTIPKSIGVAGSGFTIAFWIKTTETGGGGQWYQGDGLVDGEVGGVTTDFGTALVGSKFALGIGQPDTTLTSAKSINDGNWHYVAGTWNMTSGTMQIYVDGNLDSTGTGPTGPRTATPNLIIGKTTDAAQYFNGLEDEVRLYTNVLTAAEIGVLAGLPPGAPIGLNAIAGAGQLALNWNAVPDATGYNLYRSQISGGPYTDIVTNTGSLNYADANVRDGQTYYYVVTAVDANGESATSAEVNATPLAPPTLNIMTSGGMLTVSWSGWAGDWQLNEATNLTPPVVWSPVTNTVGSSNGLFNVNLPVGSGEQFFRLNSP